MFKNHMVHHIEIRLLSISIQKLLDKQKCYNIYYILTVTIIITMVNTYQNN